MFNKKTHQTWYTITGTLSVLVGDDCLPEMRCGLIKYEQRKRWFIYLWVVRGLNTVFQVRGKSYETCCRNVYLYTARRRALRIVREQMYSRLRSSQQLIPSRNQRGSFDLKLPKYLYNLCFKLILAPEQVCFHSTDLLTLHGFEQFPWLSFKIIGGLFTTMF